MNDFDEVAWEEMALDAAATMRGSNREWTATDVEDDIVEQMGRDASSAELAALRADAERYRWMRDMACLSWSITRDDHALNYRTAAQEIDEEPEVFHGTPPAELQRMRDTDTAWRLQVYPRTPIGFIAGNAATLDALIDAAMAEHADA